MDIAAELTRLFSLTSPDKQLTQSSEHSGLGGYLSFSRAVTVNQDDDADGPAVCHVFVKCSDVSRSDLDHYQLLSNYFCRSECVFYGLMAPVLGPAMRQCGVGDLLPRTFGQRIAANGTILVMEDLTKLGFHPVDFNSFGVEHAYCVVRDLARLQAAYWISRTSFNCALDSAIFGPGSQFGNSLAKSGLDLRPMAQRTLDYFLANLGARARCSEDEATIRAFVSSFADALVDDPLGIYTQPILSGRPIGLAHGDLWFANCMFRSEDRGLLACRLFDWQFWDVSLFGLDLAQLMLTGLSSEAMREHADMMPRVFYATFQETYRAKTGCPAPFSEAAALQNMGESMFYALLWVVTTSDPIWESGDIDVTTVLANVAFAIRDNRIALPAVPGVRVL